jgi:hypothetical protein
MGSLWKLWSEDFQYEKHSGRICRDSEVRIKFINGEGQAGGMEKERKKKRQVFSFKKHL